MRQITKDIEITIDGNAVGFRLTKLDAFSGVMLLRLLMRLEGQAEQGDGFCRSTDVEQENCPRRSAFTLLDLISFLTTGEDETRAWTIKRGTLAPQAAGKIHTDFEKGFIRAETIAYDKLMECDGKLSAAKEHGWLRSEGKDYEMKDGDVVHFLFNV